MPASGAGTTRKAARRSWKSASRCSSGVEEQAKTAVIPGRRAASNPESRYTFRVCRWIPGSLASLAPRNDIGGRGSGQVASVELRGLTKKYGELAVVDDV